MKWNNVALSGLLWLTQAGCGAGEEQGSPGISGSLALGARGQGVLEAREYLTQFGYFPNEKLTEAFPDWRPMLPTGDGEPDLFDEGLQSALQKYQRNMGLSASGVLDAPTLEAMQTLRCGNPDSDPDASEQVEKWAHVGIANRWNKTTIKYKIKQPNVALPGMATKEATKAAIKAGFMTWEASTNLVFTEVTAQEDLVVDYKDLGPNVGAQSGPPPSPYMNINTQSTFTGPSLRATVGHEAGHVIGLHHSSRWVANITPVPLMSPSGNASGNPINDDKVASNVLYNSWERMPGLAYDIGIGVGGTVWIIGTGARNPYYWNGSSWVLTSLGQPCKRLDVDAQGHPWVVTDAGVIYRHDGSGWGILPGGGVVLDIGIGRSDFVFGLGTDGRLYRYGNSVWTFVGGPAGGTSLDVDMTGQVHVVAANTELWVCNGSSCFREPGGMALDVGYGGPAGFTFGMENWGWIIGVGDTIFAKSQQNAIPSADPSSATPATDEFIQASGITARRISVGPNGRPWVVQANGKIYRRLELQ